MDLEEIYMKYLSDLMRGYENTKYVQYDSFSEAFPNTIAYEDLPNSEVQGVLKANYYVNGKLTQVYSTKDNHVGIIAATRLGKTTSYVIPTIYSFAKAKNKKSMIISDPKGEIYRNTAATLKKEGYKVLLLNFRDFNHSECWNPLTPIYRKYHKIYQIYDEVKEIKTEVGTYYEFRGEIYHKQKDLEKKLVNYVNLMLEEVGNDIDSISLMICTVESKNDPYWEVSARELLKAFLWAMLEDSRSSSKNSGRKLITEETFSFATIISLMSALNISDTEECTYFTNRSANSRAAQIISSTLPTRAATTRQCIISVFSSKLSVFRESAMRLVTCCNSFDMNILVEDEPVAIFIDYRDELKVHFKVISLFIQDAYRYLIENANQKPLGKREIPFYFILDEFGNFPPIIDFETTISACAGRNIFFILIIQSYAQLNSVYGDNVANIIRDNLNMHVFFGSNNPGTIESFSKECGEFTRISAESVLNGKTKDIEHYSFETLPLVPKSKLSYFSPGECIITEANCGYVMFSRLERYYLCKEFTDVELSNENEYVGKVNPFNKIYLYKI